MRRNKYQREFEVVTATDGLKKGTRVLISNHDLTINGEVYVDVSLVDEYKSRCGIPIKVLKPIFNPLV